MERKSAFLNLKSSEIVNVTSPSGQIVNTSESIGILRALEDQ